MLTARRTKRADVSLFNTARMYDILDQGGPIGSLVYDKKIGGEITVDGRKHVVTRAGGPSQEMVYQAVIRLVTGRQREPASWTLQDEDGRRLAAAEYGKRAFSVTSRGETFVFRRVSRHYELFRQGSDQSLGSVGQEKLIGGPMRVDLPAQFDAAFQVFLFGLVVALAMETVATDSSYSG